jgi:hypothetical protein
MCLVLPCAALYQQEETCVYRKPVFTGGILIIKTMAATAKCPHCQHVNNLPAAKCSQCGAILLWRQMAWPNPFLVSLKSWGKLLLALILWGVSQIIPSPLSSLLSFMGVSEANRHSVMILFYIVLFVVFVLWVTFANPKQNSQ